MDDQAVIRTYGNTNLPEGTADRPLVTFALFAYNQEKYIREAVEGAFSQTYSPLEIILSDDRSSDGTFVVIEEMARAYRGPHKVIVTKNRENLGTYNHLVAVARLANGELFVVNAGDDISFPHRVTELTRAFIDSNAIGLGSFYDLIDEHGTLIEKEVEFPASVGAQIVFGRSRITKKENGKVLSAPGFSAAYATKFLKSLTYSRGKLLIEDGTLNGIINSQGGIIKIERQSLISYRVHKDSLTVRDGKGSFLELRKREEKISRVAPSIFLMLEQIEIEAARAGRTLEKSVAVSLQRGKRYARLTSNYWNLSFFGRIRALFQCRSREDFLFCTPRTLGMRVFVALRNLRTFFASAARAFAE